MPREDRAFVQAGGGQLWRLTAVKNRFYNVGREEGEGQGTADVARVNAVPLSKFMKS